MKKNNLKSNLSRWRLQTRLTVFVFAIVMATACSMAVLQYAAMEKTLMQETFRARLDVMRQIGQRTNEIKNAIVTISNLLSNEATIDQALVLSDMEGGEDERIREVIDQSYHRYFEAFNEIGVDFKIVIIGNNGFRYNSYNDPDYDYDLQMSRRWHNKIARLDGEILWVPSYSEMNEFLETDYVFSASKLLKVDGEGVGTLTVTVDERVLFGTYEVVLNGDNIIYIIDESGSFVSHVDQRKLGLQYFQMDRLEELFGGGDYCIIRVGNESVLWSRYYDAQTKWTIMEQIPTAVIMEYAISMRVLLYAILATSLVAAFVMAYVVAKRTAQPIKELTAGIQAIESGDLGLRVHVTGWLEVRILSESFNEMLQRIQGLIEEVKINEDQRRRADINYLRMRINPHFMYNTLFSIRCLVDMRQNERASEMIGAFMQIVNHLLRNTSEFVSIEEEMKLLEKYLMIQRNRYEQPPECTWDIPDALLRCKVPSFLLQPILENALYHGIDAKDSVGKIAISCTRHGEEITICVWDNGAGMSEEEHGVVMRNLQKSESKDHIGLNNVHQRIQLLFGEKYGLSIRSEPGAGTSVYVHLPYFV